MGRGVPQQQCPLPDTLPVDDLEILPGSQGALGARHHHSPCPPPSSLPRSLCSPAIGATGLSEQNTQESVPWEVAPAQRLPVPLECGPEPKPPLHAIFFPLCLILPITFAQMGVNTGTSGRKGRWLVFCFEWGWVGKVELTVGHIPSPDLWTQDGAWPRARLPPRLTTCLS